MEHHPRLHGIDQITTVRWQHCYAVSFQDRPKGSQINLDAFLLICSLRSELSQIFEQSFPQISRNLHPCLEIVQPSPSVRRSLARIA